MVGRYHPPGLLKPPPALLPTQRGLAGGAGTADIRAIAAVKGWSDEVVQMAKDHMLIWGDPDTVGERLSEVMAHDIDGLTVNMPASGHIPGRVELLGETAAKVVA